MAALKRFPPADGKTTVLAGIKQNLEKSYEDFISRLEEALGKMLHPIQKLETTQMPFN